MNSDTLLLAVLDGLSNASVLFLAALGLTLIFGVMNILNVAHGSFYAFGGYLAATFGLAIAKYGVPPGWSLPALFGAAILVGVVLGTILESGLLSQILDKEPILQLLITFAAFMILEDAQRMIWGTQPYFVSEVINLLGTSSVAGITYTNYQLVVLPLVAVQAMLGLKYFLSKTATGRQVTAMTHNREVATALGVNTKRISWLTFVIGTTLGALGGSLSSPMTSLVPGMGADVIVLSFAVVATAGLGQIGGAAVAAILIGLGRSFAIYVFPELDVLVPYLIMLLVLLVRPQGMFAAPEARRV